MRTQSIDTSPEAERILIHLIREAPISKRFSLMRSMTKSTLQSNMRNIKQQNPEATPGEIARIFVARQDNYSLRKLSESLKAKIECLSGWAMHEPDVLEVLDKLSTLLEKLQIPYYIVGSVASSTYGMQQLARDIDIAINVQPEQARSLAVALHNDYHFDENMLHEAIAHHTQCNMVHLSTLLKIDIFVPATTPFYQQVWHRLQWHNLDKSSCSFPFASPEDIILMKLAYHRTGDIVPDDQWNDILGVLKVQGISLDRDYMERRAINLSMEDLLHRAFTDAGLDM